ncbi:alpha/beta fold hydrolase [Rhodococcus sp. X156]|uniref:alpha/beta fold hydrolase n=1 Tax=Rhodococcus sp. X156 TaxID=2499145 RepID=UPI000FDC58BF|nr:alpha/beta fold hydrolase [Rhodococcus sp. X156]
MNVSRTGTGAPVVLVHGLGSSLGTWDRIVGPLAEEREVIAVDLPGFGKTPPLLGEVSVATLTDALADFLREEGLAEAALVGSSLGARMVLELARRGHQGTVVALDPGGFWNAQQARFLKGSLIASIGLVRRIQPALPRLSTSAAGRSVLLAQFAAAPWKLPAELVLQELQGFTAEASPSLDEALHALAEGPLQAGADPSVPHGTVVLGWGRQDRVTLPSQAAVAAERFPSATLHWFDRCGHFPHWDSPEETTRLILQSTS